MLSMGTLFPHDFQPGHMEAFSTTQIPRELEVQLLHRATIFNQGPHKGMDK